MSYRERKQLMLEEYTSIGQVILDFEMEESLKEYLSRQDIREFNNEFFRDEISDSTKKKDIWAKTKESAGKIVIAVLSAIVIAVIFYLIKWRFGVELK